MGWADCGTDSRGRPIGYAFPATCDQPGCKTKIDRGLAYACGDMHGEADHYCEKYFCPKHLQSATTDDGEATQVCEECYGWLMKGRCVVCEDRPGTLREDDDEVLCDKCYGDGA